jgi:ABC-type sulfate transport system permease subunit
MALKMKILLAIIGAILGAVFGLIVALTLAELVSHGNTLGAGFALLIAGPLCLLAGAVSGVVAALRIVVCFRERPTAEAGQLRRRQILASILLGIPTAFAVLIVAAREAVKNVNSVPCRETGKIANVGRDISRAFPLSRPGTEIPPRHWRPLITC